ncbi:MAG: hypothetical protein MUD01_27535 [Chloroflexaceae bacterium]|jgi:hypothetical protein|nr:hypothetical protein [Chloroflexaceae bacterium]
MAVQTTTPVEGQDVARWLTFTSFWGSMFYLLSCVSLVLTHRRQPVKLHGPTMLLGLAMHLSTFVTLGSAGSALFSLLRGKSTTEISEERIGSGQLERSTLVQGLGGAAGAVVPFALAAASLRVAEHYTGEHAVAPAAGVRLPQALALMVGLTGLTSLAVSRIAGWVARDAKRGS